VSSVGDNILISRLMQYIEENPKDVDAYINLALLYAEDKKYKRALNVIEKGVEIGPDSALAQDIYAMLLYVACEYEQAIKAAEKNKKLGGNEKLPEIIENLIDFRIKGEYVVIDIATAGGRGGKSDLENLIESKGYNPHSVDGVTNFMYNRGFEYVDIVKKVSTNLGSVVGILYKRQAVPGFLI